MTVLQALEKRGVRPSVYQDRLGLGASAINDLLSRMEFLESSGCWQWMGATSDGYGVVHIRRLKENSALRIHRLLFQCANGPLESKGHAHHKVEDGCVGRICCNPDHVGVVTISEHRKVHAENRDYCRSGHAYTPENTYYSPEGWRRCRECDLLRARLYREDQRKAEPGGRLKYKWHQDKLKTHCLRGHPLSGENAQWVKTKWGVYPSCRICRKAAMKKYHEAKKGSIVFLNRGK